jgi:heme/copper-type cytochrome/quinol oxidase subunit 1
VVGHFHTAVGTAVTLTYIGISYWLIPHLAGRALWSFRLALAQGARYCPWSGWVARCSSSAVSSTR